MSRKKIHLQGNMVAMKEMDEGDFDQIIQWRNDPEINRYLNQPYVLTYQMQEKWYCEKYIPSDDILLIFMEKTTGIKFGTVGTYDLSEKHRCTVTGRLIVGERQFRGSPELLEGMLLFYDFLFYEMSLHKLYCHVVKDNKRAMLFNRRFGFVENTEEIIYPHHCEVNNMKLVEMVCDLKNYERKKIELTPILSHFLHQKLGL